MSLETKSARLMIVDDDPMLRGMVSKTLRHAGFDVQEVAGGELALELFQQEAFDLMLLDVMMPDLDGYEVCTGIRNMPHGVRVPILMLTGLNDTDSIEHAYRAGATDFIAKPINWTLLVYRVRYALRAASAFESAMQSRERLERAQSIAKMGSWEIIGSDRQFVFSPELARIFGVPLNVKSGEFADTILAQICSANREAVLAARQAVENDAEPYMLGFDIKRPDGQVRVVFEQAAAVFDAAGRQVGIEGITQDVTDRVEAERHINRLANYDALTSLPNRKFFNELATPVLERSRRQGSICAMLHLDLDRFKSVNDAYGQVDGDAVLRIIAERIEASIRGADLVSVGVLTDDTVVARVGGNAFTLLLVDVIDDQRAVIVANRLLQTVANPIRMHDRDLVLTTSIGISLYPRDADEVSSLIRCSEQAVYAAKAAGRAQYRFFDEAIHALASARLTQETDLRQAIGEGQLRLYYQPKVDATSGVIVGAEALVRWQHPGRGMVPPDEFIPLAEESGLILPLTDWVLETACIGIKSQIEAGLPNVPVSVNIAAPSFVHVDLPAQLDALMLKHGLSATCLTLEVTESSLMVDMEKAIERLHELNSRGFKLSLDDFGTGYSSLGYLKLFPIQELKIDRSFVADVCGSVRDRALATSIIALGREFGLTVIAEGVETVEQSAFLLDHGCPFQQGFLFGRPMPLETFNALLSART